MPLPQYDDETVLANNFVDFLQSKVDKLQHEIEDTCKTEGIYKPGLGLLINKAMYIHFWQAETCNGARRAQDAGTYCN